MWLKIEEKAGAASDFYSKVFNKKLSYRLETGRQQCISL